jgi:hypothetical protein
MVESKLVRFEGAGSGSDVLTWGQQEIWAPRELSGASIPMGRVTSLPPGVTLVVVTAILRYVMSRHPSLRTRFELDSEGRPFRQVLSDTGEIALEIVDVTAEPSAAAEELLHRYQTTDFDHAHEWPVRMAAVRHHGDVTHVVTVYSHLAIDAHGLDVLLADLAMNGPLAVGAAADHPRPSSMPPLEQARRQREPAGQRRSETALRYWESLLLSIPPRRFHPSQEREPRYWAAAYDSPAAMLAIRRIAARLGMDTGPVVLAAFAVALASVTDSHPSVMQVVASNRFRPSLAQTVSPVNQTGLCVIDVAGVSFDEAVARAFQSSVAAYKYAYYDSTARNALIARLGVDVACFVNDRRRVTSAEPVPSEADVHEALSRSEFRWAHRQSRPADRCFLDIDDRSDTLACTLAVDTRYVSPEELEKCLRRIESVAVRSAVTVPS